MANWPSFDYFYQNSVKWEMHETGRLVRTIRPVSIWLLSKLGQLAIRWNSSLRNRPIPLDSSRKLTRVATWWAGNVFCRPREKKPAKVLKITFCFYNDSCRPEQQYPGSEYEASKVFMGNNSLLFVWLIHIWVLCFRDHTHCCGPCIVATYDGRSSHMVATEIEINLNLRLISRYPYHSSKQ